MNKIQMTYDRVTPESAEQGDVADRGFTEPGGWEYSILDVDFEKLSQEIGREAALTERRPDPEEFESIDDAVEFLRGYGPLEPSCNPPCLSNHCWLTQTDGSTDDLDGSETRYAFHLKCDPAEHAEIINAFARRSTR